MRLFSKLFALFRRRRADVEMSAELQVHLDALTDRHVAAGLTQKEAEYAALREFGGVEQIKERCRDERRWPSFEDLLRDVHNGIRQWRRKPGLALVCICILALGIGACTAVYSTIDAVLLRPSAGSTDRVMVLRQARLPDVPDLMVSVPNYLEWRRQLKSFASLTAYTINAVNLTGGGDLQRVTALDISPEYFDVYAVKPLLGRFITPADCAHDERVAVLSYSVWQNEFAGAPDVVGRPIEVDGDRYTVIGVAARAPEFTTGLRFIGRSC